jgi:hypothetical protein
MHHLRRALATARIDDLHRDAAQRHAMSLARCVTHEPHHVAGSRLLIWGGRMWARRRNTRPRSDRTPMHREMRSERL